MKIVFFVQRAQNYEKRKAYLGECASWIAHEGNDALLVNALLKKQDTEKYKCLSNSMLMLTKGQVFFSNLKTWSSAHAAITAPSFTQNTMISSIPFSDSAIWSRL